MTRDSDQWLWFIDDELVQECLSVDRFESHANKRASIHPALTEAVQLHLDGAANKALGALTAAVSEGDVDALLLAGQIHAELKRFDEAAKDYARLAELCPSHRVASFNQGLCLAKLRQYPAAVECLQQAALRDPSRAEVWFTLGICLISVRRESEAVTCFEHSLNLRQEYVPALLGHAAALHLSARHGDALQIYERLLQVQPERKELLQNALAAAQACGDCEKSNEFGIRLLAVNPDDEFALAALASNALNRRQFPEAIQFLKQRASADPLCFENWFNLAVCYQRTGRPAEAAEAFRQALALNPQDPEALEGRAAGLAAIGERSEATDAWDILLRLCPDREEVWFQVGLMRYEAREWARAAEAFERCIELETQFPAKALVNLGLCQWREGDSASAGESFQNALKHSPEDKTARAGLVQLAIETHDIDAALSQYREFDVEDSDVALNLGHLCERRNRLRDAADVYREAVRHSPRSPEAHLSLANVLHALGESEASRRHWKAAIDANPEFAREFLKAREAALV